MAAHQKMSYSELNYLNQIGIALDPSLRHNVKHEYEIVKTKVFDPADLVEPMAKTFKQPSDLPPFTVFSQKTYNIRASVSNERQ